jgi:hypothetical protein
MRLINWIAKVNYVHLCLGSRALVLVRYKVYVYEIVDLGYPVYKPHIRKLYILLKLKLSSPSIGEQS